MSTLLGDARAGKLADNLSAFGRSLRRAGVPVDAARIAMAQQALQLVGVERRQDVGAALEAVLVSREQDRAVFAELFDFLTLDNPSPAGAFAYNNAMVQIRKTDLVHRPGWDDLAVARSSVFRRDM